jgi:NADPH:quinone reductase-like Zn-dependent oxidoreductase
MKAVRIHEYGGIDAVSYEDAPEPELHEGDVLVRVHAAGVNPFDWYVCMGLVQNFVAYDLPVTIGCDVSGVVEKVGPGVQDLAVGDEVYGQTDYTRDGSYAEFVAVPESRLAKKPAFLTHTDAAAIPNVVLAAWDGLFGKETGLDLTVGQTVLINGGAGGIGHLAVQLAKWRGATVIATGSPNNDSFLRGLGADLFVDYTKGLLEDAVVDKVDGVLDTVGGTTEAACVQVVKPGGTYVTCTMLAAPEEAERLGVRAVTASGGNSQAQWPEIARLVDERVITPTVSDTMPLAEARRALELSQAHHVRGKIVLDIA